jgi:hypothetical protein
MTTINPPSHNFFTKKPFLILVATVVLLCGGLLAFKLIKDNTTLSFSFLLDGKQLSVGMAPTVKVDGLPFTSGCTLAPGRHELTAELQNAESFALRVWVFYGNINLGDLPLESSKGSLLVSVNPSPASVIVRRGTESIGNGDAPLTLEKLPFGDYELEIKHGEYKETHSVKITGKQRTEAKIDLNLGGMDLSSAPADAEFELSGNGRHWQGKLPTKIEDIPGGNYSLVVRRKGWELNKDISISRGSVTTNKTEFQYGSIEVTSDPAGLLVSTNGVGIDKTPLILHEVKPGQYTLAVSDGENDLPAKVSVGPKEAVKHAFVFHYGTVQLSSTPTGATVIRKGKEIGKTPLTLNHIPAGETMVELRLQDYVSTNLPIQAVEGVTTNLSAKLISERYLQVMKQARGAFDSAQYAESQKFLTSVLESEPNDPAAMELQDKVSKAAAKAEEARKEAEHVAEIARKETEQKKAMENRLVYEQQFQQLIASIQDSSMFANYSRKYSSDFDKVWNVAINVLKQQTDKIYSSNHENGIIMTDLTRHGIIGFPHYDRYLLQLERIDIYTTKINLKLMTYWVDFNNNLAGIKRPEKADFIQRRANDYFDKIGRELNAPIATALAQTTLPEVETTNNSAQNVNPTIEQSKSITNAPEPFVPTMPITGVPSAANAKHNISDPQVEKLCKYLESDKPGKVIFALKSLRKMRATEAATRILPCLTHSNPNVIRESCRTLTIIGNKDAIPAIELLLTNARPDLVREACRTLAILGNKNVIPVIEPLLTNSKSDIRKEAQNAITQLQAKP